MAGTATKTVQKAHAPVLDVEHPRFAIPFRLVIEGRRYEGVEISLTEMTAMGLADRGAANSRPATIQFPFSSFDVDIAANVDLLETHTDTGLVRFAFSDPLGAQRIPLQSVFNAYIAGEMTHIPGLIGGTATNNIQIENGDRPKASFASRSGKTLARFIKGLFFGVLGLGLAAYVATRIYERAFIMKPIGVSTIAADTITLNALKTGPVVTFNSEASIGQSLFGVLGDGNSIVSANLPCDCEIVHQFVQKGGVAIAGSPVVELIPAGSPVYVLTTVNDETYTAIEKGATITATLSDASIVPVTLLSATPGMTGSTITLKLATPTALTTGQIGQIVSVKVDRFPLLRDFVLSSFAAIRG